MKYFVQICCTGFCLALSACETTANLPVAPEITSLQDFMEQRGAIVLDLEKLPTGHEMLSVEINGVTGNFILDSGAGATVLHDERVSKYRLDTDEGIAADPASGAGGQIDVNRYDITSFKLEGHSFELDIINTIALTSVVQALKAAAGVEIDGVIGQDILTSYGGVIDVANSRLYLSAEQIASERAPIVR